MLFHCLKDSEDDRVVFLHGHAVRFFEVAGVIVSLDPRSPESAERIKFTLDDGTGLIECVVWQGTDVSHSVVALQLGAAVRCQGRVGRFRGTRQLTVDSFWPEPDCMAECWHWVEARKLWRAAYIKPFRVPQGLGS